MALSEFRATPPGQTLALLLSDLGLVHQRSAANSAKPARNSVFLAARHTLRTVRLKRQPDEPNRWLLARIAGGPWIGVLHAPNYVTGRKRAYFDAVLALAHSWRGGPALIGGDTNTGVPPLDGNPAAFRVFERNWIPALQNQGWFDVYRQFEPTHRAPTWYSPNAGNGYRLDQAFANRHLLEQVTSARYHWGCPENGAARRDVLSDHAALLVDLQVPL